MPRFLPSFGGTPLPLSWFSLGGSGHLVVQAPAIFLDLTLGSSLSLPVFTFAMGPPLRGRGSFVLDRNEGLAMGPPLRGRGSFVLDRNEGLASPFGSGTLVSS